MRKQELVHLHALGVVVKRYVERTCDVPEGAFEGYDALDVTPTAIDDRKAVHRAAVTRVFYGIGVTIGSELAGEPVVAETD